MSVSGNAGRGVDTEGAVGEVGGVFVGVDNETEDVRGGLKTRSTSPRIMHMYSCWFPERDEYWRDCAETCG